MRKLSQVTEGSAQMIGVVIAGLVAIIIGLMLWYKINSALFYSYLGVGTGAHAALNTTVLPVYNTVNASANSIWTLFPIVAIVVVAGVILAVVMGFGRSQA